MIEYFVSNDATHLKALLAGDRIDDHVTMYTNEVLAIQNRVLVLPCCINDLGGDVLVLISNDFAERVFDGGIIRVDEVAVDILHRQRALACAPACEQPATVRMRRWEHSCIPTDLLPTMAILRCFCCGGMVGSPVSSNISKTMNVLKKTDQGRLTSDDS